jgi:hypothetical protein
MAKAIIVYDTPYSPTDEQWVEWLAKPQWTAAEAAALSLNILPGFTRVSASDGPSDTITTINAGADNASESVLTYLTDTYGPDAAAEHLSNLKAGDTRVSDEFTSYTLKLIGQARAAGQSVEHKMERRAQALAVGPDAPSNSEFTKYSPFNMYKLIDRPGTIADMQYREWNLPAAMIGQPKPQPVAESIGESLMPPVVEKAIKVEGRLLSQKDVKNATLDEFYAECNIRHRENNWPEKLHTLDMLFFYQHKDPPTIARMMKRGEVPRPTIPSKKGSARRWELSAIREHEAELQTMQDVRQAALDTRDKNL